MRDSVPGAGPTTVWTSLTATVWRLLGEHGLTMAFVLLPRLSLRIRGPS